jgi:hypothetical protein
MQRGDTAGREADREQARNEDKLETGTPTQACNYP